MNSERPLGVIGFWGGKNYGSELTNYATYYTLVNLGYKCLMIDPTLLPEKSQRKSPPCFQINPYPEGVLYPNAPTKRELSRVNNFCDIFISTSDQQLNNWVYNRVGKTTVLDWIFGNKRKIAYAASYGHDFVIGSENDRACMAYFLQKFDYFSVREKSAISVSSNCFGLKNVVHVLDPVFLCDTSVYNSLIEKANVKVNTEKYVFAYILDTDKKKERLLKKISSQYGVGIVTVSDAANEAIGVPTDWDLDTKKNLKVEEWLSLIKNSEIYITDSFHGTCFAIIYKKNFIALSNSSRGVTRFTSLMEMLGLEDRLAFSIEEAIEKVDKLNEIDWNRVDQILSEEKQFSLKWLTDAIEAPFFKPSYCEYDVLIKEMNSLEDRWYSQFKKVREKYEELSSEIQTLQDKIDNSQSVSHEITHEEEKKNTWMKRLLEKVRFTK